MFGVKTAAQTSVSFRSTASRTDPTATGSQFSYSWRQKQFIPNELYNKSDELKKSFVRLSARVCWNQRIPGERKSFRHRKQPFLMRDVTVAEFSVSAISCLGRAWNKSGFLVRQTDRADIYSLIVVV